MTDFGFARITAAEADVKNMTYCGTDVSLPCSLSSQRFRDWADTVVVVHESGDDEWRTVRTVDRRFHAWDRLRRNLGEASCGSSDFPSEHRETQ